MYAVIFKAEVKALDEEYEVTAQRLRDLALSEYGCTEFTTLTEGNYELAISYWPNRDSIKAWKSNPEHLKAQELGRKKWYRSYQVQIVEVLREYSEKAN